MIFTNKQVLLGYSFYRTISHEIPPSRSLNMPKTSILTPRIMILVFVLLPPSQRLKSEGGESKEAVARLNENFYPSPSFYTSPFLLFLASNCVKHFRII